ncbi:hypothetical protein [Amycolatopsis sp. cmx-8-4]|uniref:hypothetical protein n=1 Tax=Amycolatopsis sp. cmx-8-4 TaxID=2790947 RepID=UPI00397ACD97
MFAELLRVFVTTDQAALVDAVDELSRFPHPLIRSYGGQSLVQSVRLTTEEEILVHLMHERSGMTQSDLLRVVPKDGSGVRRAIKNLTSAKNRQIVAVDAKLQITDLGISRIENRLIEENENM